MLKGFFIQYKFITPSKIKHTSYTYQKLFRSLYGYTQNVSKSSGKTYKYKRKGILSDTPYIRPGKNCVIIPSTSFNALTNFFKTGKNPTHYWQTKGDWKAVYYMDEKNLEDSDVIAALERLLDRSIILKENDEQQSLSIELTTLLSKLQSDSKPDKGYVDAILADAEKIVQGTWFKDCYLKSDKLVSFFNSYKSLKSV